MYYGIVAKPNDFLQCDVMVIGFFDQDDFQTFPLNPAEAKLVSSLSQSMTHANQVRSVYTSDGKTVLLIHCGKQAEYDVRSLQTILKSIWGRDEIKQANTVHLSFPKINNLSDSEMGHQLIVGSEHSQYEFKQFKTDKKDQVEAGEKTIKFYGLDMDEQSIARAKALANGIQLARDLANTPANICNPSYLAEQAQSLAEKHENLVCKVLGRHDMAELGMNLLLSVGQGSEQEPRLIELQYHNGGDQKPIVLIGKGITFDSGGYTLKPGNAMEEMKYDMCGAASVLGVIQAIAEAELAINVVGIVASAENLISGRATKPGDVFTSMSGKTVEVVNTDAEGRLVLADALTYAERFEPEYVVDIATLTGAMVIALGHVYTGIFSQDNELAESILTAASQSQDLCWQIPLHKDYADSLESQIADIANASWDRSAGSITAAWFLSHFTKKYRWAHCDIAGTAWHSGKKRNATGRPVPMLYQLIINHIHHEKS